jgi:hypothetical protein
VLSTLAFSHYTLHLCQQGNSARYMFRPIPGRVVGITAKVFAEVIALSKYLWRFAKVILPFFWVV